MYKKIMGFTLAETMIVLVILGIIASITIPAVIRNQIEAQNRTRIRKAMTVYDMALNKIVVENGIKSNDALYSSDPSDKIAFAPQDNCTRSSAYFKINRTLNDDNGTNCRFCSSDNVCWDISNILKPIIGIGEEGITNENSTNRYRMFAHFGDNGELRVDDLAYEQSHEYLTSTEKEELAATYNFANNVKEKSDIQDGTQEHPYILEGYGSCQEKHPNTYCEETFINSYYNLPFIANYEPTNNNPKFSFIVNDTKYPCGEMNGPDEGSYGLCEVTVRRDEYYCGIGPDGNAQATIQKDVNINNFYIPGGGTYAYGSNCKFGEDLSSCSQICYNDENGETICND